MTMPAVAPPERDLSLCEASEAAVLGLAECVALGVTPPELPGLCDELVALNQFVWVV